MSAVVVATAAATAISTALALHHRGGYAREAVAQIGLRQIHLVYPRSIANVNLIRFLELWWCFGGALHAPRAFLRGWERSKGTNRRGWW